MDDSSRYREVPGDAGPPGAVPPDSLPPLPPPPPVGAELPDYGADDADGEDAFEMPPPPATGALWPGAALFDPVPPPPVAPLPQRRPSPIFDEVDDSESDAPSGSGSRMDLETGFEPPPAPFA